MCANLDIVISFLRAFDEPCRSVAARRIPADCRAKLSFEPFALPIKREAERRNSRARIAAPVGLPYGMASPVSGRDCRSITRTGAPLGAPLAFSLDLRTAFWKRTGAAFTERP
jgi:hypothetical protein